MTDYPKPGSGICIPCSVRSTPDKGLGVFAEANVPRGSTIWRHVPGQYEVLDKSALENLLAESSHDEAVDLLIHIVSMQEFPAYMVRFFDEGALLNHSEQPNVMRKHSAGPATIPIVDSRQDVEKALQDERFSLLAACDLAVGDELLMNYNEEPDDPDYYEQACRDYGVNWEWL